MKQIKKLTFRPTAATNTLNCYPTLQRRILPYLTNAQIMENVHTSYKTSSAVDIATLTGEIPPPTVEWDPRFQGDFVFSQLAGSDNFGNGWNFRDTGFVPRQDRF